MWRKLSCLLLCIAMLAGLAGCGQAASDTGKTEEKTADKVTSTDNAAAADTAAQNKAYGAALWDIYLYGILPDNSKLDYVNTQQAEENTFAIYDIDHDGREELVVQWSAHAAMASKMCLIYGYDNGKLHEELSEYVAARFFSNGAVEANWSHNQGLGDRFWPYNVYTYDAKSDSYRHFGAVDGWDKQYMSTFYGGEPFPDDLDQDGGGLIYFLYSGEEIPTFGDEANAQRVDGREYEAWRQSYLNGATEITLPTKYITPDNITPLGCPMP